MCSRRAGRWLCAAIKLRERAENLARLYPGAQVTTEAESAAASSAVDLVIVATTHDVLAPLAARAASAGKHVLLEKPGARYAAELDPVAEAARSTGVLVRVGFNHRYHRAFRKARAILDTGALGEPMFVRARYGHGGRPGYEKEWRAVPDISGGGEAIDQGVHLIDLARWFLGEFVDVQGAAPTFYWNMPVEDNAFFLLRTVSGRVAFLHASWTEWKNLFSFEYSGRCGKLEITGLGGSYGTERLAHYQMLPENGSAGNHDLRVSGRRRFLGGGDGGLRGRHPAPALRRHRASRMPRRRYASPSKSAREGNRDHYEKSIAHLIGRRRH